MKRLIASLAGLAMLAGGQPAHADVTADALLKVLVRKGVLTQEEAADVKAEAARDSETAKTSGKDPTAALQATVAKMQKTTVSGYVQFRAVSQKYARPSTQLMDRRARVSVKNTSDVGRLTITLEGCPTAVALYDGYYDWFLRPNSGKTQGATLRMGQFSKPFGMEMETPPADLEMPELPVGWGVLFPGYRDVGLHAYAGVDPNTRVDVALLNGNGAGSIKFDNRDNDNYKDVLLRVRHTVSNVGEFALSGYRGQNTDTTTKITGDRNRWGIAGVFPNVVGGQLRTEYIAARDLTANLGAGAKLGTADARAWEATYVHPVAPKTKVALRYDSWDPDTHNTYRFGGDGEVNTVGLAGIQQISDQLKLSLSVERPRIRRWDSTSQTASARNEDVLTFQGQYRF
ncbi:MAG TPA: hypothetical protein VGM51_18990 [Armatimonadota bacterium]|jgi:polyhydroxyalkanoate synthesis regulator phasin